MLIQSLEHLTLPAAVVHVVHRSAINNAGARLTFPLSGVMLMQCC